MLVIWGINVSLRWIVRVLLSSCLIVFACGVSARGVSPYLPLGVSPAMERKFEQVLILAGRPMMRRPIPAAVVLDALPDACKVDEALCAEVRTFIRKYEKSAAVTSMQTELSAASGDSDLAMPNAHGRTRQSEWQLSSSAFYQPFDHLSLNLGAVVYQGRTTPTGTYISMGTDYAQLDVGYRDHWFSPLSSSSMLISTEAPTLPAVTLSNWRPLTSWGITYEAFAALLSEQNGIQYFNTTTSGRPRLAGIQVGIEPVVGYALTANRLMQYGGGARGGTGIKDLIKAFYKNTSGSSNVSDSSATGHEEFGNQVASVAATMQFPGAVPFAVNIEYAGEDNNYSGDYRLGDSALSLGIDFPKLLGRYDLQYETSEWQNVWYTHHLYPEGLTNQGLVLGHWFGDQRQFGDQVGGRSQFLQLGLRTNKGAYWQLGYKNLDFMTSLGYQSLPAVDYRPAHEVSVRYSDQWLGYPIAAEVQIGRDAFGDRFGRISALVDFVGRDKYGSPGNISAVANNSMGHEVYWVAGLTQGNLYEILSYYDRPQWSTNGYLVGIGARRQVGARTDLGMRLEVSRVHDHNLLSIRAVDLRRKFGGFAASLFGGVGAYQIGQSAFGWHWGGGLQWLNIFPKWDVGVDLRYYDKLSRNHVLPGDVPSTVRNPMPRVYFDIREQSLYFTRSF